MDNNAPRQPPEKKSKTWLLKLIVSGGIITLILTQVDIPAFLKAIVTANPLWLAGVLALIYMEQMVVAFSWRAMLSTKGFNLPFKPVLDILLVSNFIGFVMPSSMGSDVVKVVSLSRYISNTAEALSSLVVFRGVGYIMLFGIAATAAALFPGRLPDAPVIELTTMAVTALAALFVAGFFFSTPMTRAGAVVLDWFGRDGLKAKLLKLHSAFISYMKPGPAMYMALSGAAALQMNRIICVYMTSLALGFNVDFVAFCVFVPVIAALMMIPVSISGIGVREGGYVFFFTYAGLDAGQALSLGVLSFAMDLTFVMLGGLVYWKKGTTKPVPGETAP